MTQPPQRTKLEEQRSQFDAEFVAIHDQIAHACADLGALLHSYRLDVSGLNDAQSHALASVRALRQVVDRIPGQAKMASPTRPQAWAATLADQLDSHRVAVAQTLSLAALLPGIDHDQVGRAIGIIANELHVCARNARKHQPTKARE